MRGARHRHLNEPLLGQPRPQTGVRDGGQIAILQGVDPGAQVRRVVELVVVVMPVLGKELLAPPGGLRRAAAELRNRFGGEDLMHVHDAFPPFSGGAAGERTGSGPWHTRTPLRQ